MRFSRKLALALLLAMVSALHADSQEQPEHQHQHQQQQQQQQNQGGILSLLLSPLGATLDHAKSLLGMDTGGAGAAPLQRLDALRKQTFDIFARLYNKTYSAKELQKRMRLFFERRKEIEASVKAYAEGKLSFMMRENEFTDWDEHEIKALAGVAPPKSHAELLPEEREALRLQGQRLVRSRRSAPNETELYEDTSDQEELDRELMVKARESLPKSKDWRASNCVAPPVNQKKCGCCYAIATVSMLETNLCLDRGRKGRSSPLLSSQQVVDCSFPEGNSGCEGGWPTRVLRYLQRSKVLAREACYPLARRELRCSLGQVSNKPGCVVSASPTAPQLTYKVLNNENDILYHVARTGPVTTVMRTPESFLYYGSGVFDDRTCSRRRDDVDHAVLIVGYGSENGIDYWLIKNSWGTEKWGHQGYGKVRRGTRACSIGHWGWVITS